MQKFTFSFCPKAKKARLGNKVSSLDRTMILGALTHFSSISYLVKLRKKTWDRSLSAWLLPLQKKKKKVFPFFLAHLTVEAREESRLDNTLESYWVFLLIFRWDFLFDFINTITDYLFSDCNLITENFESKFYQTKNFESKFYQITCYYNIFKCFFQKCLEFDNLKAGFFFLDASIYLSKYHCIFQTKAEYLQKSFLFSNVLVAKENMPTFLQSNFSSFSRF